MGYLATYHAIIAWNWELTDDDFCKKLCTYLCTVALTGLVIIFMVIAGSQYAAVAKTFNLAIPDLFGCLGGFVTGLFSAFMLLPKT
jgi:hypothetical protein